MPNIRIAARYAESLMSASEDEKLLDRVTKDIETLEKTLRESRDFVLFLKSPVIKRERKLEVFRELFGKAFHPLSIKFLEQVASKGREDVLPDICTQFFLLSDQRLGIVQVEVTAATDLSKAQQETIQKRFEEITGKKVRLHIDVDKDLKGGFLARVGDSVFDGSIRRQLELLRMRFIDGTAVN